MDGDEKRQEGVQAWQVRPHHRGTAGSKCSQPNEPLTSVERNLMLVTGCQLTSDKATCVTCKKPHLKSRK